MVFFVFSVLRWRNMDNAQRMRQFLKYSMITWFVVLGLPSLGIAASVLVETESFDDYGGWKLDTPVHHADGIALSAGSWARRTRGRRP